MPLDHYGVLVGTLHGHVRDQPDTQGAWYHVNLQVDAPLGRYRCAIDVDSKLSTVGVEWKVLRVEPGMVSPVVGLASGYHELQTVPASGALDVIRHPALGDFSGCMVRPPVFVRRLEWLEQLLSRFKRPWTAGTNLEAATALESILVIGRRTLVWGEPFTSGLGMHNVHQNQGDPAGSQWWAENGIWQDGGTFVERPDGSLDVFISKFSTQANRTDDAGHPA